MFVRDFRIVLPTTWVVIAIGARRDPLLSSRRRERSDDSLGARFFFGVIQTTGAKATGGGISDSFAPREAGSGFLIRALRALNRQCMLAICRSEAQPTKKLVASTTQNPGSRAGSGKKVQG